MKQWSIKITIRHDIFIFYPILLAILSIVVGGVFIVLMQNKLPDVVPLYYSLPWGEERLAQKAYLYLLPAISLFILLFNFVWMVYFFKRDVVLSRIIACSTALIAVLSCYTLIRIIILIS